MITSLKSRTLQGSNIHHSSTVMRQEVDMDGLQGRNTQSAGPAFGPQFLQRFEPLRLEVPGSAPSDIYRAEQLRNRLLSDAGAPFAEVVLEAVLAVETALRFSAHIPEPIGYAQLLPGKTSSRIILVWESRMSAISRAAGSLGVKGVNELLSSDLNEAEAGIQSTGFEAELIALRKQLRRKAPSTTTSVLARAARMRGIPVESLGGPFLRLGHGCAQHMIYSSFTANTKFAATRFARNKSKTNRLLAKLLLPVPEQQKTSSLAAALDAADGIGYPVVVKPMKDKQAAGVSVGVKDAEELETAFERAQKGGFSVLVEKYFKGHAHRLLVIGGRFVAALKIEAPTVTGDGTSTIEQLVEGLNSDSFRDGVRLFKVDMDDELTRDLARMALT